MLTLLVWWIFMTNDWKILCGIAHTHAITWWNCAVVNGESSFCNLLSAMIKINNILCFTNEIYTYLEQRGMICFKVGAKSNDLWFKIYPNWNKDHDLFHEKNSGVLVNINHKFVIFIFIRWPNTRHNLLCKPAQYSPEFGFLIPRQFLEAGWRRTSLSKVIIIWVLSGFVVFSFLQTQICILYCFGMSSTIWYLGGDNGALLKWKCSISSWMNNVQFFLIPKVRYVRYYFLLR